MIHQSGTSALLGRRLERLRNGPRASEPERPPPPPATDQARQRAERLARELGGELLETNHGPLAQVVAHYELPLDPNSLRPLPLAGLSDGPLVCLDLETTGLGTASGTLAFMVGLGSWHGTSFRVTQLLLPDHADEQALLAGLAHILGSDSCLVTYNGRSFDWPLLLARYRLWRWSPPLPVGHLDLLPVARQLWRHRLADARLATVEAGVCGVNRTGDLPGALVPQRYFGYLRERRAEVLRDVLEHNRQDVVSLARLLQVLAAQLADQAAWQTAHPGDLRGLARAYARLGKLVEAEACLEAALASPSWKRGIEGGASLYRRLASERAQLLARLGRREESLSAWLAIGQRGGPGSALAWVKVASHLEHFARDFSGALAACRRAAASAELSRMWGRPMVALERDLHRRLRRLHARAGNGRPAERSGGLAIDVQARSRRATVRASGRAPTPLPSTDRPATTAASASGRH